MHSHSLNFPPFFLMAQQSSSNNSLVHYMRYSASQPSVISASTIGVMMQDENDLTNKFDYDAIYELMSLGTRYLSFIIAFFWQLQCRTREVEKFNEKIYELQRFVHESNKKI